MARRKPLPTRRGRGRRETSEEEAGAEAPAEAGSEAGEAEASGGEAAAEAEPAAAGRGGLELTLMIVTLISLIAAFALIQLRMHSAFGKGWPV